MGTPEIYNKDIFKILFDSNDKSFSYKFDLRASWTNAAAMKNMALAVLEHVTNEHVKFAPRFEYSSSHPLLMFPNLRTLKVSKDNSEITFAISSSCNSTQHVSLPVSDAIELYTTLGALLGLSSNSQSLQVKAPDPVVNCGIAATQAYVDEKVSKLHQDVVRLETRFMQEAQNAKMTANNAKATAEDALGRASNIDQRLDNIKRAFKD